MNISSWTVRMRLAVGFGLVCGLLVIIVGVGLFSLDRMGRMVDRIVNVEVVKVESANTVAAQASIISIAIRDMLLVSEPADRQKLGENIAQARTVSVKNMELLDRLIVLPKGKELLAKVKDLRSKYVAGQETVLSLIATDKIDEAKAALNKDLRPLLAAYMAGLTELSAFQTEVMQNTAKTAEEADEQAHTMMLGLGLLAILGAIALGYAITRSLLKELGGEPSAAADLALAVSQGDFTRTVVLQAGDTTSLMANLGTMQGNLAQIVSTVRVGSEGVATASAEIAQGNNDLSSRTEQQASALEQTAASMEELGSTVKQNADSARQANQLAQSASTVAIQGGEVVGQVVETMKGINASSRKISDIISVIDGIAFQTNILALNAAVEAARAGEQGRGFAVVASEVRSLAKRSADAAKEIKALIAASVERVEQGTAQVDQAGSTMEEIVAAIGRVSAIVGEISSASAQQSSGVSQVSQAVTQMDQTTQQNAALVEQSAAAAESLKLQARQLVQAVAVFRLA